MCQMKMVLADMFKFGLCADHVENSPGCCILKLK